MARKKSSAGTSGNISFAPSTNPNLSNFYTITTNGTSLNQPLLYNTGNSNNSLHVKGDVEIEGKLKMHGYDVAQLLDKICDRLAIIMEPDEERLRQFPALKKAYNQYKVIDALVSSDKKGE